MGQATDIRDRRREVVEVLAATLLHRISRTRKKTLNPSELLDISLDSSRRESVTRSQTAGTGLSRVTTQEEQHGQEKEGG